MRENWTILGYGTWDFVTPKKQWISAVKRKITENIAQTAEIEITDYTKLGGIGRRLRLTVHRPIITIIIIFCLLIVDKM